MSTRPDSERSGAVEIATRRRTSRQGQTNPDYVPKGGSYRKTFFPDFPLFFQEKQENQGEQETYTKFGN